jgi:hypothetical protein
MVVVEARRIEQFLSLLRENYFTEVKEVVV